MFYLLTLVETDGDFLLVKSQDYYKIVDWCAEDNMKTKDFTILSGSIHNIASDTKILDLDK